MTRAIALAGPISGSRGYNKGLSDQQPSLSSFEANLSELESIVKQLESGDLPLEKALELFERGAQLTDACRRQLEQAESKVELLVRRNDSIQAEPFKPGK